MGDEERDAAFRELAESVAPLVIREDGIDDDPSYNDASWIRRWLLPTPLALPDLPQRLRPHVESLLKRLETQGRKEERRRVAAAWEKVLDAARPR